MALEVWDKRRGGPVAYAETEREALVYVAELIELYDADEVAEYIFIMQTEHTYNPKRGVMEQEHSILLRGWEMVAQAQTCDAGSGDE